MVSENRLGLNKKKIKNSLKWKWRRKQLAKCVWVQLTYLLIEILLKAFYLVIILFQLLKTAWLNLFRIEWDKFDSLLLPFNTRLVYRHRCAKIWPSICKYILTRAQIMFNLAYWYDKPSCKERKFVFFHMRYKPE